MALLLEFQPAVSRFATPRRLPNVALPSPMKNIGRAREATTAAVKMRSGNGKSRFVPIASVILLVNKRLRCRRLEFWKEEATTMIPFYLSFR